MNRRKRGSRGVSPIISSIIMTAMVLVIGAGVWGVATGASTVIQKNYYEEVMVSVEKIKERFCIENIGVDSDSNTLKIWIYNYGTIAITVEMIRVQGGGNVSYQSVDIPPIAACEFTRVDVNPSEISFQSGMSITVEIRSNRGNKAYDSIRKP